MIVLDASALVDFILGRPGSGWLVEQITAAHVCAPSHQPAEALSAFARMQRAGQLTEIACVTAAEDAMTLTQEVVRPSSAHAMRALALAARVRIADGLYVALAEERGCPLLTTDRSLARSVTTCEVLVPPD